MSSWCVEEASKVEEDEQGPLAFDQVVVKMVYFQLEEPED